MISRKISNRFIGALTWFGTYSGLQRCRKEQLDNRFVDKLRIHSDQLSLRDCLNLLSQQSSIPSGSSPNVSTSQAILSSRIKDIVVDREFGELELLVLGLSRLQGDLNKATLVEQLSTLESRADWRETLYSLNLKESVNILNAISKIPSVKKMACLLVSHCMSSVSEWDHRTASLLLNSVSRLNLHPPKLPAILELFCENQDQASAWTPQSLALFVLSLSKLNLEIKDTVTEKFVNRLVSNAIYPDFSDQQLCNLIVGITNLDIPISSALRETLKTRTLKAQDLLYLLKSQSSDVANIVLDRISWTPKNAVIACDLAGKSHAPLLAAAIPAQDLMKLDPERTLYAMVQLNMGFAPITNFTVSKTIVGSKAAEMLGGLFRLGAQVPTDTIRKLSDSVINDSQVPVNRIAMTILSLSALQVDSEFRLSTIDRLLTRVHTHMLNDIDKRQMKRAACILFHSSDSPNLLTFRVIDQLLSLADNVDPERSCASSRTHKQVKSCMQKIIGDEFILRDESLVEPISSFIDILVSPR